jgi:hypothetical protein
MTHTTPRASELCRLLGCVSHGSVQVSNDEFAAIRRLYKSNGGTGNELLDAIDVRDLMRAAEHDGLRILAWLARHAEPGEDPLKLVVRMASDVGCDIDPADESWACGEESEGQ